MNANAFEFGHQTRSNAFHFDVACGRYCIPVTVACADGNILIDLPEGGQLATCSFTVTSDNNGTSVRCTADDGTIFTRSTLVYAYAQGKW